MTKAWWLWLGVLGACGKTEPKPPPAAAADGWQCFVVDPKQPVLPQGNVTHIKQRFIEGRIETANVNVQGDRTAATRLVYRKVGDHYESELSGLRLFAKLYKPDASHWAIRVVDDKLGYNFEDEMRIDATGLTVTSTEHGVEGAPKSVVKHLPAPCSVVDAELAKHPG
jgi:hypothetical protein